MYEEVDSTTLSQEQLRKVVKTRWVVGDRPDPTTAADTTTEKFTQANYGRVLLQKDLANTSTTRWSATQLPPVLLA